MWDVLFWPIMACVLLPWLLVYLGLHVVQRGIIFIDIAMAQLASLGICVAIVVMPIMFPDCAECSEPDNWRAFVIALTVTLLGAALFSLIGKRASAVPAEAIIGITYVVSAATSILLLSRSAHGNEEIRNMLVGDITVVRADEVWRCLAVFLAVGAVHFALRKSFLLVSFNREQAYTEGLRVRWWDFLFYALFGLVVTIFVRVAGVLLVFSYLIVPAVCAITVARKTSSRLLIGWLISLIGGVAGLYLSFYGDFPSGSAIVCTFGALLILVSLGAALRGRRA